MFDIKPEVATAAVAEAAKQLEPLLQAALTQLLAGLQDLLKGRVITITIQ